MTDRGKFISFEGGEGAGKSTQARALKAALEEKGRRVSLTREPGGSPGAEEIRALLVEGEPGRWTALAETLLFLAARADHVERLIEPALKLGIWVVCDRFSDSTLIYQGIARGLGLEKARALQEAAFGDLEPDLTLILDLPVTDGLRRAHERGAVRESRFEKFGPAFHESLRAAFRDLAATEPRRCALVDGTEAPDRVAHAVWRIVEERLSP